MSANLRQDVDFSSLFRKLGHNLEEIRVRSLKNIVSKLDHKLICESDLVHERHFIIRLLEWFNFKPCPMQKDVLDLLLKLAQHTSAAELILSVGGLDFLTKLRPNVDVSLQPIIDQLMECLMRLPAENADTFSPECFYQGNALQTPGEAPILNIANQAKPVNVNSNNLQTHVNQNSHPTRSQISPRGSSHPDSHLDNPERETPIGYFVPVGNQSETAQSPTDSLTVLPKCFKMTTFPWLPLTSTDRHVLSSTNISLQSTDETLLNSTCEFLSDVVFQDFPAEVFLQRPAIVKSLLALLNASIGGDLEGLSGHVTQTLMDLTQSLRHRLLFYQDPALYSPKQDFSSPRNSSFSSRNSSNQSLASFDGRPPVTGHTGRRHRGDGRDQDSSANGSMSRSGSHSTITGDPEETDIDDMASLQLMLITLPQYSVLTLDACLPLLKASSPWLTGRLFLLATECIGLTKDSLTSYIWDDTTAAARDIVEKLEEILEKFGELLLFHHHSNWCHGHQRDTTAMAKETGEHRVTYLSLSHCLRRLLELIVPLHQARNILPDVLTKALGDLVFDESLGQGHLNLRQTFLAYVEVISPEKYQEYVKSVDVCKSVERTCQFLFEFHPQGSVESYLPLGVESLPSLPYHRHAALVEQLTLLSSLICIETPSSKYQALLLKLLSHPMGEIRVKTYQTCYRIITTSLNVEMAADPKSTASQHIRFLLDTQILQEVVYFGLADSNKEVHDLSTLMLTHLLQSELLMTSDLWRTLLSALLPALPVLQGYTEIQSSLGSCVMGLIEPELKHTDSRLPPLERLRGWLRLMLSSDTKCRAESLKRLAWFLSHEEDSHKKLPSFSDLDVSNITNLFIVQSQRTVEEEDSGQTVFKVDGMQKVFGIFVSQTVEANVRKSAIDQLAIILQDPCLHPSFLKDGGLEKVLEVLHKGVLKTADHNQENFTVYVPACLTILRHLIHHSSSLRHRLAHQSDIYYSILRGALLYHENLQICYDASHLITLLLFDETAIFQIKSSSSNEKQHRALSFPSALVKRYRLPIKTAVHYDTSPHQVAALSPSDPLLKGMPAEMIRITWNSAWHGGMEKLITAVKKPQTYKKSSNEFPAHLHLSPSESVLLLTSDPWTSLREFLYNISNATSHQDVKAALWNLTALLAAPSRQRGRDLFHQLDWCPVIGRFLRTVPSSSSDDTLLFEVLQFVTMLLRSTNQIPDNILHWLVETVYHPSGPLIGLLSRSHGSNEGDANIRRRLDKQLLTFISTYSRKLPSSQLKKLDVGQLRGNISHKLLLRLNVAEAPHFYNLAMLEGTLSCLMTITSRPGWSVECTDLDNLTLCSQLLNSLLEVVSAFHIGRGGTSMSYMGKGVTKAATVCLRQLAYEMAFSTEDMEWPKNWLYSRQGSDTVAEPGLNWLLTLWTYRDPEVRAAGLGIAVSLTSTQPGRVMMMSNCKHIPGGIWGAAFSILLDQSECSIVRQQAALLLVNLTSQSMPSGNHGNTPVPADQWQGPTVTDMQYGVSLVGLTALLALLHHSQFYQEMLSMCENFFPQPAIHPVSLAAQEPRSHHSSQTSLTTLDSSSAHPAVVGMLPAHSTTRQRISSTPTESILLDRRHVTSRSAVTPVTTTTVSTPSVMFGAQFPGEQSTSSVAESQGSEEYQGVTTPSLLAAFSQLLKNLLLLAPQDTLTSIKKHSILPALFSLHDVGLMEAYCSELRINSAVLRYEVVSNDLLDMITGSLDLTRVCLTFADSAPSLDGVLEGGVLDTICKLSGLEFPPTCQEHFHHLLSAIYTLLTYILTSCANNLKLTVIKVVSDNWEVITRSVRNIFSVEGKGNHSLYLDTLQFTATLLATEGKLTSQADLSWRALLDKGGENANSTVGVNICESLLTAYERLRTSTSLKGKLREKTLVISCFRILLGLSGSAKSLALKAGLVESLIDQLKQLNQTLLLEPQMVVKTAIKKKQEDPTIKEVILIFDLLKNFMYENTNVKVAAYHSGLANVIHSLWTWCMLTPDLMNSALSLLVTFISRYTTGAVSLACTNPSSMVISPVPSKLPLSNNSMVHAVIKLAQTEMEKTSIVRSTAVFNVLKVFVLTTECRNIIWKSNFLSEFSKLNPKKQKKSKVRQCIDELWLDLLVNLSFSTEGQQMICKINDCITLLLEFGAGRSVCREKVLLILRNLCFHTSNKPKLLANDAFLPFLLDNLCSNIPEERSVAASALYALAFNNQKAKVSLKSVNISIKAREAMRICLQSGEDNPDKAISVCLENLKGLIVTMSE